MRTKLQVYKQKSNYLLEGRRCGELIWGRYNYGYSDGEGALLIETTAKYYKQWKAKSKILQVCHYWGHTQLKGAHMGKWNGPRNGQDLRIP